MKLIVVFIFSLIIFNSQELWAKYTFENISVKTIDSIKKQNPELFNTSPDPKIADQIIEKLIQTQQFQNVAIYADNGNYHVIGFPLRKVRDIQIVGNKYFSKDQLYEIINLNSGFKFDRKKTVQAANNLKEFYGNQGFFNTKIEVSFLNEDQSHMDIIFNIDEGNPCLLVKFEIKSENQQLSSVIVRKLNKFKNKNFTSETISEIENTTRNYFKDKGYLRSKLSQIKVDYNETKTQATLFYEILNPFRYEIVIKQIKKQSDNKGLNELELRHGIALKNFEVSSLDPAIEVEQKVRQLYLKKGFANVQVNTRLLEKSDKFFKQILVFVDEGPRVRIDSLNVVGRISRPENYYVDFIFDNSSDTFRSKYYIRKDLELGYDNLITHLKNQGFLSAKIQSSRIEYNNKKDRVKIQIVIDEGPLTQILRLRFDGVKDFSPLTLSKIIDLKTDSPLRLKLVEESINKLKNFYKTRGYLEMKILNENDKLITYNTSGTEASIDFKIYEGPKIIINSISIEGNDFTQEEVILKEIELKPGEILTNKRIEEVIRRLTRLGFFSRVTLRTLEEGTSLAYRTVIISVSERKPGLFRSGIGVTSEEDLTLRGFIGSSYNNLYGTGRGISGRVELKSNVTKSKNLQGRATMGYFEPYLFQSRTRGRVNLSYELEERDYKKESDTAQMRESNRMDFLLEREFSKNLKLTWTAWSIETERNFEKPASGNSTESHIAALGPLFEWDYRNNPFLPTNGHYTRWETEFSNPILGSSEGVDYFRTDLKYSFYIPISETDIVWANNVSGGYLKNLDNDITSGVPSSRSFFLHGQSKIRGYGGSSREEHIPNDSQYRDLTGTRVTGDSNYYLFKTELRIPIKSLEPMALALFYDIGAIQFSDSDKQCTFYDNELKTCMSTDPIRQSVGIGIHLRTPLGPIVLELAKKIAPHKGERLDRIHFSIGSF
ncbi:MAG: BamA/TamA family outer membrane protein [Bdellovibrionaceae bacterium]|nr:BamA/TamA family outer membrane protein [Pseudobdellovibrionaceae bacterium]